MDDFGYDVADYRDVDPLFGTLDDFRSLIAAAHARGIRVLIDQVLSHSSDRHPWFAQSRRDRDNDKADWYVWADPAADGSPPNNWMAAFGGQAWTFDAHRHQYYLHNFLPSQPDLNFHHPAVQQAQLDNLRFWLDLGVDGFRFDVVNFYFHDQALRDNLARPGDQVNRGHPQSYQWQTYNTNQPENLAYLERVRALLDEYPGSMTVGEIGGDDTLGIMAEYTAGDSRLHMAYTFDLLSDTGRADSIHRTLSNFAALGDDTWPCWALSNHDVVRSASKWGASRALLGLTVLASLRGNLCLYQGEELGLPEAELTYEDLQDPFGVNLWPEVKGRDGCRTPMPWQDAPNAGFSPDTVATWLPVYQPHRARAGEVQQAELDSFYHHVAHRLALRADEPALRRGEQTLIEPAQLPSGVLALVRHGTGRPVICVANLSDASCTLAIDALCAEWVGDAALSLLSLPGLAPASITDKQLTVPAASAAWVVCDE